MTDKLSNTGLIAAEDLYYLLGGPEKIKVLDATYSLPGGQMSPEQAFFEKHIEGAQFFNIDVVADQDAPLPHTIPSAEYFAACVSALGISSDDHVVVYDQSGMYMASSRAWWMFRAFGHDKVYVLEGGLQAWTAAGFRTIGGPADAPKPGHFTARLRPELVVGKDDILDNLSTSDFTVIDARPMGRFAGRMPEPRPGMRAGHIPGSVNLPFIELLTQGGLFKKDAALEDEFSALSISHETKTAVSCGSGVTACTVALALFKVRGAEAAIYDGSWSEWGDENSATPVEVSA